MPDIRGEVYAVWDSIISAEGNDDKLMAGFVDCKYCGNPVLVTLPLGDEIALCIHCESSYYQMAEDG